MNDISTYVKNNKDIFLEELFNLLRIPSISALSEHKKDMIKCAEYWKELLLKAGTDKAEIYYTDGNPIVYAEKIINVKLPTILVYAHYDVMPIDPLELWNTNPFEPVIIDDKIYARGANDDKGQSFIHLKAFEFLVKTNQLPCNVKFMIEGEEEIGSTSLTKWCKQYKDMLNADIILVSDTSMIDKEIPSITTGLRGLAYWEVEVTGPNKDLHSGIFGGAVANPINMLAKIISNLIDEKGKITIPGFYDDVIIVSDEERQLMSKAPFNEENYKKAIGVKALFGEEGYTTYERTGIRPSLDVCGIWGGYTKEGTKTILPSKAYAKISVRLVPEQNHENILKLFKDYLENNTPPYVSVNVTPLHGGKSYACPINIPAYKAAEKAYYEVYGKQPIPVRSGGSIPIIANFEEILNLKSILMGFGLESDFIHSPNENFDLDQFFKGN